MVEEMSHLISDRKEVYIEREGEGSGGREGKKKEEEKE